MNITFRLLLLSATVLALSGPAQAQAQRSRPSAGVIDVTGAANTPNENAQAVERADERLRATLEDSEITDPTVFVKSAALGEIAEIELAKLAQSKSQDAGVRNFAARMLEDHAAIRTELAKVAGRKRLDVPTSLVYEDEQTLKQGAVKSGAQFDAWYARQMLTEYDRAIALFQAATRMQDADLAAFAKKTLPTLQEHQRMAADLAQSAPP